jgi:hypothetical protein
LLGGEGKGGGGVVDWWWFGFAGKRGRK